MALDRVLRAVRVGMALLVAPLLVVGCAGLNAYRSDAEVTRSRYTTIVLAVPESAGHEEVAGLSGDLPGGC